MISKLLAKINTDEVRVAALQSMSIDGSDGGRMQGSDGDEGDGYDNDRLLNLDDILRSRKELQVHLMYIISATAERFAPSVLLENRSAMAGQEML